MLWKKIPYTNEMEYISGWEALNIPDENRNVADWHPRTYLTTNNPNEYIKTYKLDETVGNIGIKKINITFPEKAKVYMADFTRAIIDIILFSERDIQIKNLFGCKNDLLTDEESSELFNRLISILEKKHKRSDKIIFFLENEFPRRFYKYKRGEK